MINLDPKDLLKMNKENDTLKSVVTMEVIKELVKKYQNDMDLGKMIRKIITSLDVKG